MQNNRLWCNLITMVKILCFIKNIILSFKEYSFIIMNMEYIKYIINQCLNCFNTKKTKNNENKNPIFNQDEGDIMFYSCFEDIPN